MKPGGFKISRRPPARPGRTATAAGSSARDTRRRAKPSAAEPEAELDEAESGPPHATRCGDHRVYFRGPRCPLCVARDLKQEGRARALAAIAREDAALRELAAESGT